MGMRRCREFIIVVMMNFSSLGMWCNTLKSGQLKTNWNSMQQSSDNAEMHDDNEELITGDFLCN